jgi:hypothetical protein
VQYKGPWSEPEVEGFLDGARFPLRIACNTRSGHPLLASLWFTPSEGGLWCATKRTAAIVRLLENDARCGFELAQETPPYRGVRGRATARLVPERGPEILRTLLERYRIDPASQLSKSLLKAVDQEVAIRIGPSGYFSWDFSERMRDAIVRH